MPAEVIITDVEEKQDKQETPASKPAIGIIYPPPEVRNIVDKTGGFVARNGPEFEARIRQNEINNPKFNFLNPGDPYHAYYQHKVREFKEGKPGPEPAQVPALQKAQAAAELRRATEILKSIEQPLIPKEPPPEPEFIADPPSISALDLDLVRLTAQFAARNGRQFLTTLVNREQHNYQFHFLKPHHSLFQYFTKLLKQYTKILIPPKDLMNKLKKESTDPKIVLDQVRYRVEWTRLQETQRRKEEEAIERERVAYAQIDWHDFLVVETVDYQQNEQGHFPPPTTPDEVGNRVLQQERLDEMGQEEMEVESESDQEEDEEENENKDKDDRKKPKKKVVAKPPAGAIMAKDADEESLPSTASSPSSPSSPSANSDSEEEEEEDKRPPTPPPPPPESIPQPPPLPPNPDQVVVRKDYDPKAQKTVRPHLPDDFLVSPLTGERIPASKVQEHMRIGLLDPRWVEQRDRFNQERAEQEEVYAAGSAIESSLKELAQRRTDIFGTEETAIGRKIGEEDQKPAEKVTWDGHTASMEAATRAARANITIEEQIHQIHKVKGLLPDEEKERIGPSKPTTSSGAPMKQPPLPPTPAAPKPQPPPPPVPAPIPVIRHPPPPPMHAPLPPLPPMGMIMVQPQPPVPMGPPVGMRMMGIPQPPMHHSHLPPMPPGTSFQPLPPGAPPGMHPPLPGNPPPPPGARPPQTRPAEDFDGPPNKKLKTEESLIPEDEFLKKNKSPTVFKVACPNAPDKPEWKLIGQMMTLTMPLTDPISVIKAKIHEQTNMPPGKQKLQYEGMFVKDSNTLAFYNLTPGSIIHLQLKERGGRKK